MFRGIAWLERIIGWKLAMREGRELPLMLSSSVLHVKIAGEPPDKGRPPAHVLNLIRPRVALARLDVPVF
ncbi:hypothetical protein ACFPOU_13895 [Massilia jejuensis]|uniref:Uncharacterized protein n=1 Tax=Massilia jejuensis TaxID=648894 RepID=A0ABW0PNZ5_9BURK